MTGDATSLPAFLDALHDALVDRTGLDGVNVFTCPVDPLDLGREAIEFANEVQAKPSRQAMGSTVIAEEYEVPGAIVVNRTAKPGADQINAAAKAARDRTAAILAEVTNELSTNDTLDGTVTDVAISDERWVQGMAPENRLGRYCRVEFRLTCKASVTP